MCWKLLWANKHKNVNKTRALQQTTGGIKDEPNIIISQKS